VNENDKWNMLSREDQQLMTNPTIDQSEIAILQARIERLERLNTEEHATIEDLSTHIDTLCDALERHTDGEYRVQSARKAVKP
jgi:hypothetical protein